MGVVEFRSSATPLYKRQYMKYKPIKIKCEICGKKCSGLIGLYSHISQAKNHITVEEYKNKYSIDKYIKEQMKIIFYQNIKIIDNGCWLWTGDIDKDGYGVIYAFSYRTKAHRFSYELFNNIIKNNLCVCHSCDTPGCVNPKHLWLGTSPENTQDSINKGRRNFMFGETNPSKRTEVREKISKSLKGKARPSMIGNKNNKLMYGDDNPMKNPDVVKKCFESRRRNNDS